MIQNNVIHSAWKNGVKKLLFLGSTCIYPKNAPKPLKEDYLLTSQLEFTNEPYAIAKIAGLKLCESYNLQYNTNFISVMPTNLYGFGDNYDLEKSHVLPALLRKFHLGKCLEQNDLLSLMKDLDKHPIGSVTGKSEMKEVISVLEKNGIRLNDTLSDGSRPQGSGPDPVRKHVTVNVWGSGDPLREFMYSKDMAEACVFIMENIDIKDITEAHRKNISTPDYHAPHFLNIGTGEEISIRDLAKKIWDLVGFKGEILFDPSKPDGTMRKVTDVSLLRSFGFTPKVSLDEGLRETYWQYLI